MKRLFISKLRLHSPRKRRNAGYTLIEMLVATALTLVLIGAVVRIFGQIGGTINDSRFVLETLDRLRSAEIRLQKDLAGATVTVSPPRDPRNEEGYLEIVEGPVGRMIKPENIAVSIDPDFGGPDSTPCDFDDVLMLTTRSDSDSFVGMSGTTSNVAEVAWFVRGNNLYRRVLLVAPNANTTGTEIDISLGTNISGQKVPNTLGDLTDRRNRFAHGAQFPHKCYYGLYGLPTIADGPGGPGGALDVTTSTKVDLWKGTMADGSPLSQKLQGGDLILSNVIGFDVKVWDVEFGAYVDLGSNFGGRFGGPGHQMSGLSAANDPERVYDTWSLGYESDGIDQLGDGKKDLASNGFDDNNMGGVDDITERETMPPYPFPLRGIKVEIRVFEPSSRQVRTVTVIEDFLPK